MNFPSPTAPSIMHPHKHCPEADHIHYGDLSGALGGAGEDRAGARQGSAELRGRCCRLVNVEVAGWCRLVKVLEVSLVELSWLFGQSWLALGTNSLCFIVGGCWRNISQAVTAGCVPGSLACVWRVEVAADTTMVASPSCWLSHLGIHIFAVWTVMKQQWLWVVNHHFRFSNLLSFSTIIVNNSCERQLAQLCGKLKKFWPSMADKTSWRLGNTTSELSFATGIAITQNP